MFSPRSVRRLAAVVSLALPTVICFAQDPARMDRVMQSYVADDGFMGSVLVARGDQVVFSRGYGSANLEWNIPNAPDTKFRLGSVTKQFTAASILLLQERGKLSVHDPVKKYLPDAPAAWDRVTIAHLLSHTSGIPSFTDFPDYAKLEPFATTSAELVARFRDKPLDFPPGEKWSYSNSGYVLLSYLIERITGERYERFVHDNLFAPLGMTSSGYDVNAAIIPHRASGYVFAGGRFTNAGYINMTVPQGAGGLYSTTEDLLKWERALFGGKVLHAESLSEMTTPVRNNYAFGLAVDSAGGHRAISHSGGIEGFNTILAYYPDEQMTVVVLANVNGTTPGDVALKLAALGRGETVTLANERHEIAVDSTTLERYVGAYRFTSGPPKGAPFLVTRQGTQLFSRLGNQQPLPIFPESPASFFVKAVDAQLVFSPASADARSSGVTLHQNGNVSQAERLSDAEGQPLLDAAARFATRFRNQTPAEGGEAVLRRTIEALQRGAPDYTLLTPDVAATTRQQLSQIVSDVKAGGDLKSIAFKGVGPGGADIYTVTYERGVQEWRIWLTPDRRIQAVNYRVP